MHKQLTKEIKDIKQRTNRVSLAVVSALLARLSVPTALAQNAPVKSLPPTSAPRIGVIADKQTILTLRDAIALALENNHDIEIERLNTQLNEFDLRGQRRLRPIAQQQHLLRTADIAGSLNPGRRRERTAAHD